MADIKQKQAARKFAEEWNGIGQEDEHSHKFWLDLLQNVLGIEDALSCIDFEKKVKLKGGSTKRIDGYIARSKVMIEQKSIDIDLDKPQQGHNGQTPFQQAKFYNDNLNYDERVRWIIVSNFAEIRIYDMNDMQADPTVIMLSELPEKLAAFDILKVEKSEMTRIEEEISVKAGEITGKLYDALIKQYADPNSAETLRSLNQLCVRLVFCLYAEDAGVFTNDQFHDYLVKFSPDHFRSALKNLFKMLDTPDNERDPDDEPALLAFPYVNGGLFADETIRIPQFNEELKTLLLDDASLGIDWSGISPTIFGAVFESTLNPETRRSGGMHYTSIENIHKVIDPLFLDDLKAELNEILALKQGATIQKRVAEFQQKLSGLTFLDPACGSGNFLTETYLCLRRLENEALKKLYGEQIVFDSGDVINVKISQFYGIEINDFAVTVAKTALWIAESQTMRETMEIVHQQLDFLPLTTNASIVEGNALRLDWSEIVPPEKLNYIMGNPPFLGYKLQNSEQKEDLSAIFKDVKNIDYVAGWYLKTAQFIVNSDIQCAFVSTNSICQGEQVTAIWKPLITNYNIEINYAYPTFVWDSQSNSKASVHCVIIGFSAFATGKTKRIFFEDKAVETKNINPYLVSGTTIFIEKRSTPLCKCEQMIYGSEPREGGFLLLDETQKVDLIKETPASEQYIKRFVSSEDYINNKIRYCLWLDGADVSIIKKSKIIMERLKNCREFREKSKQAQAHAAALTPALFASPRQPKSDYLLVPVVSSANRMYIPIGYVSKEIIASNACFTIPNASLYSFGVLVSSVHNAWNRAICGRLKSDYRYSNTIVYNNFSWCEPTAEQKAKIEQTAQAILDARAKYPDSSLADLYDELSMPLDLRKAHQENDKAVLAAYGLPKNATESEIVAFLFKRYAELTSNSK